MSSIQSRQVSGHVFRYKGARGDAWYTKYRLPDGRQVQKRIGSCAEVTRREANAWLAEVLGQARACKPSTMRDERKSVRAHSCRRSATC